VVRDGDRSLFRGGQISLGIAAFVLGMVVLSGLRWFDYRMKQEQHGTPILTAERYQPPEEEIRAAVGKAEYKISISSVAYGSQAEQRQLEFKLQWRGVPQTADVPPFLRELAEGSARDGRSVEDYLTQLAMLIP
jgi:hypothetical protein